MLRFLNLYIQREGITIAKKVFFGLSGGLGPVLRCLPIANLFKNNGDQVVFSIYDTAAALLLKKIGYLVLDDDDPSMPAQSYKIEPSSTFFNMDHYFAQIGLLDQNFLESWIFHRIAMLEKVHPDIVFVDMSPHTLIAAKFLGVPVVSITQGCFHPQGEAVFSWGEHPRNLPKIAPIINPILDNLKLPSIERMEELNSGDLDIIPGIPETDPISDPEVVFLGPINTDHNFLPETVSCDLLKPYILVYTGRLQDSTGASGLHLLKLIVHAFKDTQTHIYITSGTVMPSSIQNSLPKNIVSVPFFSEDMLKNSILFIHHGGHGSCLSSLKHGIPSLIIPTHTEREYNARKIQKIGTGEYMLPGTFTAEHLRKMCTFLIEDNYLLRAQEKRSIISERNYGGKEDAFYRSINLVVKS
ncbi:MAG: glycosyltransferase [Bacillota bacterium]